MKYTFKDFITGRLRYTRGTFSNWTQGGPLNAWYAVFCTPRGHVLIPEYLLTAETRAALPARGSEEQKGGGHEHLAGEVGG